VLQKIEQAHGVLKYFFRKRAIQCHCENGPVVDEKRIKYTIDGITKVLFDSSKPVASLEKCLAIAVFLKKVCIVAETSILDQPYGMDNFSALDWPYILRVIHNFRVM
jgi:hypothetical protein